MDLLARAKPDRPIDRPQRTFSRKFGLVIVDMMEAKEGRHSHRRPFTYLHGSVETGIGRVCSVIRCARKLGIPVILVKRTTEAGVKAGIVSEIQSAVRGYPLIRSIEKEQASPFSNPDFIDLLQELDIETPIIVGYNRTECVLAAVMDALDRGLSVITSDELLFGSKYFDYASFPDIMTALAFYRRSTVYFEDHKEVLRTMDRYESTTN